MKLKITTKPPAAPEGASAATPSLEGTVATPTSAPGPKLKFKINGAAPPTADGASVEAPKQKRKYTKKAKGGEDGNAIAPKGPKPKKRAREDNGEDGSPAIKRKPKPTAKSLALLRSDDEDDDTIAVMPHNAAPRQPTRTGSLLKIKMKTNAPGALQRTGTIGLKIKGYHGKPPVRPPGVGYDSEAEEAEEDPAIESQFVLRMQPGPDCDLLRKAIEEKTLGKSLNQGGTAIQFRFFDKEGRRATVNIQGRLYAACMVDLPCVLESMKSWNKKDWVKTADVCQMLLVLGRVQSEDEAKKYPFPRDVDPSSHQYAHGLTPPMRNVRRRRFRPRASYHRIEEVESQVNALLAADANAKDNGGESGFQIIDTNKVFSEDDSSDEGEDEDAEGEDEDMMETTEYVLEGETPGGEQVELDMGDNEDLAEALAAGLMEDDDDLFEEEDNVAVETPATAHDVAMHALGGDAVPVAETAASTPEAVTSPDDDEDDDDDAETPADGQADTQAAAVQEGPDMTEILELEAEIANMLKQAEETKNVIYKKRCLAKVESYRNDRRIKRAALGLDDDGE
jgi:transcription initiation factor TFIID subunit 7